MDHYARRMVLAGRILFVCRHTLAERDIMHCRTSKGKKEGSSRDDQQKERQQTQHETHTKSNNNAEIVTITTTAATTLRRSGLSTLSC